MNFAHLHLVLTHFPPVLSLCGSMAAAGGLLIRGRRQQLIQLALLLLIVDGLLIPVVYFAGLRTAGMIGKVEGVQQEAIAPHEEAATVTLYVSIGAALIAALLFVVERRHDGLSPTLGLLVLLVSIASAGSIGWTAARGGAIHHPEIGASRTETSKAERLESLRPRAFAGEKVPKADDGDGVERTASIATQLHISRVRPRLCPLLIAC